MHVLQLFGSLFLRKRRHYPDEPCTGDAADTSDISDLCVPVTCLHGKYVLLLLHEPLGLFAGPRAATRRALRILSAYRRALQSAKSGSAADAPLAVLEVRMPLPLSSASPSSSSSSPGGAERAECADWFVLDSAAAFRQIVRGFGVATWPSVLLFGPTGELLTPRALEHMAREMEMTATATETETETETGDADRSGESDTLESVDAVKTVTSSFPWVTEETLHPSELACAHSEEESRDGRSANGAGKEKKMSAAPLTPELLLWRLLSEARRVRNAVDDNLVRKSAHDKEDGDTGVTHLDGAKFLLVCFGSSWHTASKRFLPRLRSLWSSPPSAGANKQNDLTKGRPHDFLFGGSASAAMHGVLSYQMGNFTAKAFDMTADSEDNTDSTGPHNSTSQLLTRNVFLAKPDAPATAAADDAEPLDAPLSAEAGQERIIDEPTFEVDTFDQPHHEQGEQAPYQSRFQVLYVNCSEREDDLLSALDGLPEKWVCISPCFGDRARSLVEVCREVLDVDTFPRLVVAELLHEGGTEETNSKDSAPLRIVNRHAEGRVVVDEQGKDFPWPDYTGAHDFSPEEERDFSDAEGTHAARENNCRTSLRLPFYAPLVVQCRTPGSCARALKSAALTSGALVALCSTGRVEPKLHKMSADVLCEAREWCADEMAKMANSANAPAGDGGERGGVPVLPLYFMNAVAGEREEEEEDESRESVESLSDSDADKGSSARAEQKALLQEYALAELLEKGEWTIPPVLGELFLLVALWPERRVAVLRRGLDGEGPVAAPPANARGMAGSGNGAVLTVGESPTTAATTSSPLISTKPEQGALGESSIPDAVQTAPPLDPVCSLPHVKAFLSKHIFGL